MFHTSEFPLRKHSAHCEP